MKYPCRHGDRTTIPCEVHIDEHMEGQVCIEDLSDEDLLACVKEAAKRKVGCLADEAEKLVRRALDELVCGNVSIAKELLESALMPPDPDLPKRYEKWLKQREGIAA